MRCLDEFSPFIVHVYRKYLDISRERNTRMTCFSLHKTNKHILPTSIGYFCTSLLFTSSATFFNPLRYVSSLSRVVAYIDPSSERESDAEVHVVIAHGLCISNFILFPTVDVNRSINQRTDNRSKGLIITPLGVPMLVPAS